ncbi:MAG TPA: hypothetical protein DIW44_16520 [Anaerolineaceae bacterium]|nr:hypothetical protein [Anaerolineaceae bacterium]
MLFLLIVLILLTSCTKPPIGEIPVSTTQPPVDSQIDNTSTTGPEELVKEVFTCLPGIVPGKTSRAEITQLMGEPVSSDLAEDGSDILFYPSAVEEVPDTILIRQDIVEIASALNRDISVDLASIQEKFGEPEQITYSYFSQGTYTYLYPQKGFTLVAEPEGGQVYWSECFISMSLEDYLARLGSSLPFEDPYIR